MSVDPMSLSRIWGNTNYRLTRSSMSSIRRTGGEERTGSNSNLLAFRRKRDSPLSRLPIPSTVRRKIFPGGCLWTRHRSRPPWKYFPCAHNTSTKSRSREWNPPGRWRFLWSKGIMPSILNRTARRRSLSTPGLRWRLLNNSPRTDSSAAVGADHPCLPRLNECSEERCCSGSRGRTAVAPDIRLSFCLGLEAG